MGLSDEVLVGVDAVSIDANERRPGLGLGVVFRTSSQLNGGKKK